MSVEVFQRGQSGLFSFQKETTIKTLVDIWFLAIDLSNEKKNVGACRYLTKKFKKNAVA